VNADAHDPLRPRRPGGMGRGAMFALVVHVGLILALAIGVNWRSSEPAGVSAELWAAVPEVAAPAPAPAAPVVPPQPVTPRPEPKVEPPPPKPEVNEAEIALEKAKVEKARRQREEREEREAKEKAEAFKKQRDLAEKQEREKAEKQEREKAEKLAKADAARIEAQRKANLERIQGMAGATGAPTATGTAQRDAGPSATYAGRVRAAVRPNIVFTEAVPATLRTEVEVRATSDGTIVGRRIVKSSGNSGWDDAVLRALDKTETLPKDTDGRVPSPMLLVFTPV
jgi:colicin import membrane protein